MEIVQLARKLGVNDAGILHACGNAIRIVAYEYNGGDQVLVIGADRTGRLLELVVDRMGEPTRIIHADVSGRHGSRCARPVHHEHA